MHENNTRKKIATVKTTKRRRKRRGRMSVRENRNVTPKTYSLRKKTTETLLWDELFYATSQTQHFSHGFYFRIT